MTWQPWRLGVVLDAQRAKAVVGLRPSRQPDGALASEREAVEISFEEMKWAQANARGAPKAVTDVLSNGDVIWVAPKDAANAAGAWSLMQIPEVGGGDRRHGPPHRPRACGGRRLLFRHQPIRPRRAGQAPAGLLVQAAGLCRRHRQRLQADQHRARRADRDRPGARQGSLAAEELRWRQFVRSLDAAHSASRSRATR